MIITAAFGDHAAQHAIMAVEKETFAPLRKAGLLHAAEDSYSTFAKTLEIAESKHTQNAYLLQYQSTFLDSGNFITPEDTSELLASHLRVARNISLYGQEFLSYLKVDSPPSDDLYAAAIASPSFMHRPDNMTMIALIGEDAYNLMHADTFLLGHDRGRSFYDSSISPEAKLLHLAHMKVASSQVISKSWSKVHDNAPITEIDLQYLECMIEQLENINPLPNRNSLERTSFARLSELQNVYKELALLNKKQQSNPLPTHTPPDIHPV